MTAPQPDPHPSGPWGPRELIRYARAHGFRPVHRGLTGSELVWSDGTWRVEVHLMEDYGYPAQVMASVQILRRSARWPYYSPVELSFAWSADDAFKVLVAVGALPGIEVAA